MDKKMLNQEKQPKHLDNKKRKKQKMVKTNTRFKIWVLVLVFVASGVSYISANAAELSNPEQQKLQEKFARICSELESYIKNSDKMPLQPIDEWSELMDLVKKQREAEKAKAKNEQPNNLTDEEKQKIENLQKKEWKAMGEFVSVGTGPNSPEWKKLEQTTEKINKLTLDVISTIQDAYALAKGVTPEAIKKEVWVKHPKEDRMVFNKAGFEKLAEDTNGKDKNFARLLQTGGIVDELFKRYEMFFRMTDWKALEKKEKERIVRALDNGYPGPDKRKNLRISTDRADNPAALFNKKWDEVHFDSVSFEDSKQMVMNYRMSNLAHIRHLFVNIITQRKDVKSSETIDDYLVSKYAYFDFSKNKLNYKAN